MKQPLVVLLLVLAECCETTPDAPQMLCSEGPCLVVQVETDGQEELRFYRDEHHFATVVSQGGTFNLRFHPSEHPDAWGTSCYLMPHLPGAILSGATVEVTCSDTGVSLIATGVVSRGVDEKYGTWDAELDIAFDPDSPEVLAEGTLSIDLDGPLDATTGDLSVVRVASNFLQDVPLLGGGIGNTGDMSHVTVTGDDFIFDWVPDEAPGHFPTDTTTTLTLEVVGTINSVDTAAQGYAPINEAPKPTVTLTLATLPPESILTFGGLYDTAKAQDFWEDNVGVTPLVRAPHDSGELVFEVGLSATP